MSIRATRRIQEAVAEIYRGVLLDPIDVFKETTLGRVGALIRFSSAVRGSSVHSSNEMLSLSAVDRPIDWR